MQSLDRLKGLCTPPEAALDVLTTPQWNERFGAIGTRLPEQLVQLNRAYGAGYFESIQSPINASFGVFSPVVSLHAITRLSELRLQKVRRPKAFPAALYFEPGGLLPVGWIAGDIDICFRVAGDNPDAWQVTLLRAKTNALHNLNCSLLEAVESVVVGKLESELFSKHLPSAKGYRYKSSTDVVQQWHAG